MKKVKKNREFLEDAAEIFDLPGEVVAGMPRVTITGCKRVFVENHRGILEYGEEQIDINGGRTVIRLRGEKLVLRSMSDSELLITGKITGMDFKY